MRRRRLKKAPAQLEITAFINLIVVLVPFLLSTAVFTRLSVLDLGLPAAAATPASSAPALHLEFVIRGDGLDVGDGLGGPVRHLALHGRGQDFAALNDLLQELKSRFPEQQEATLLAEPETPYDEIVQVMDVLRGGHAPGHRGSAALFPRISLGDAPARAAPAGG